MDRIGELIRRLSDLKSVLWVLEEALRGRYITIDEFWEYKKIVEDKIVETIKEIIGEVKK